MGITAGKGPHVIFGAGTAPSDYNNQRGPSLYDQWMGLLDPRALFTYAPGQSDANPVCGWFSGGSFVTIDTVIPTLADDHFVASYSPGAGTTVLTLRSANVTGIVVGQTVTSTATGLAVTGLIGVGDSGARQTFGDAATIQVWDPTKCPGRNVRITSGGNDTGVTFSVDGFDVYGNPMTEDITGASGGIAAGLKAFKFIRQIRRSGAVATTIKVGTGDVIGLPLRCDSFGYLHIMVNNARVTASTGFIAGVTTDPNTAILGDTRGTYALQVASNGTLRQTILQNVSPANVTSATGLLGVAPFAA